MINLQAPDSGCRAITSMKLHHRCLTVGHLITRGRTSWPLLFVRGDNPSSCVMAIFSMNLQAGEKIRGQKESQSRGEVGLACCLSSLLQDFSLAFVLITAHDFQIFLHSSHSVSKCSFNCANLFPKFFLHRQHFISDSK